MQNIFDGIQKAAFAVVANTFGYPATWQPAEGGALKTAVVLYKDATEKTGLSDVDFNVDRYVMEYQRTDFDGLKQSVSNGGNEKVIIETVTGVFREFYIRRIETKYDGKTVLAILNPT